MRSPPRGTCPTCGQPLNPPQPPQPLQPLLSVSDAAYVVGVTRKTIYRWIHKEILTPVRLPSGILRIYPESLMRIMHPGSAARDPAEKSAAPPSGTTPKNGMKRGRGKRKRKARREAENPLYSDGE